GISVDCAGFQIDAANAMIADIGNVQIARLVESDAMRTAELGFQRRTAIAAEARLAGSGHGGDYTCLGIDATDEMVLHLDEIHIPVRIEADFVWFVERSFRGGPTIAGIALLAIAGHAGEL